MKANSHAWDQVNVIAHLADLKETNYRQTLAISALIEILVEKGMMSADDFHRKAAALEREDLTPLRPNPKPSTGRNTFPSTGPDALSQ